MFPIAPAQSHFTRKLPRAAVSTTFVTTVAQKSYRNPFLVTQIHTCVRAVRGYTGRLQILLLHTNYVLILVPQQSTWRTRVLTSVKITVQVNSIIIRTEIIYASRMHRARRLIPMKRRKVMVILYAQYIVLIRALNFWMTVHTRTNQTSILTAVFQAVTVLPPERTTKAGTPAFSSVLTTSMPHKIRMHVYPAVTITHTGRTLPALASRR